MSAQIEVYGPIFLGNSILKILLYIVHRHLSLTCTFRLIILCVSSEDLSEVLRRMSLLYFTFQNMKVFKGYLLFSPRKCNKKLRLSIRMSENWKKKWLKRLTPVTFSSTFWEGNFFVSIPLLNHFYIWSRQRWVNRDFPDKFLNKFIDNKA